MTNRIHLRGPDCHYPGAAPSPTPCPVCKSWGPDDIAANLRRAQAAQAAQAAR